MVAGRAALLPAPRRVPLQRYLPSHAGINILDDIHAKCKGGFRLADHLKGRSLFRSKREENALSDLFQRVFEVDRARRATIPVLRDHPALRSKPSEEEATTEEEAMSESTQAVEWELNQIRFVQKVMREVEAHNFLSPFLLLAFKFYIHKVLLYFLNRELLRNYRADKDGHPKLLKILADTEVELTSKLEKLFKEIRELKEVKESIANFEEGFTVKLQDFSKFKMGYRNTVGKVY